jgi:hypothetical protein
MSDDLDLVVWYDESRRPRGFQLCYDRGPSECALTWLPDDGFSHRTVDNGDRVGGKYKATPILLADRPFPANRVADRFADESGELPAEIADFVMLKLRQHPDYVEET